MPTTPSVLVFDVNETLLDIDSLATLFAELFGDRRVSRERFAQLVMYSMTATLAESYVNFSALAQGELRMLGDVYRITVTDDDVHRLRTALLTSRHTPTRQKGLPRCATAVFGWSL
jgi:2-haloacid dehalogenase